MKQITYLILKHFVIPLLGLGFFGGVGFIGVGIYNILSDNNTSGEFTYGVPLLVISTLFVYLITKLLRRKKDESIADFLFSALFWAL
jgi:hypothetical protein